MITLFSQHSVTYLTHEVLALCVNPFSLPRWSPLVDCHLFWYTDRYITGVCEMLFRFSATV
jgi:hypothetical protein